MVAGVVMDVVDVVEVRAEGGIVVRRLGVERLAGRREAIPSGCRLVPCCSSSPYRCVSSDASKKLARASERQSCSRRSYLCVVCMVVEWKAVWRPAVFHAGSD